MEKMKNKNGFLITCMCCIVLLLTLCYFGINSTFKGTSAASTQMCKTGYVLADEISYGTSYALYADDREVINADAYCCPTAYTNNATKKAYAVSVNGTVKCMPPDNGGKYDVGLNSVVGAEWTMTLYHKFTPDEMETWMYANDYTDPSDWDNVYEDTRLQNFVKVYDNNNTPGFVEKILAEHGKWLGGSGWKIYDYDPVDVDFNNDFLDLFDNEDSTSNGVPTQFWMDIKVTGPLDSAVVNATTSYPKDGMVCMQTDDKNIWKYTTYEEALNSGNTYKDAAGDEECKKNNVYYHIFDPNGGVAALTSLKQYHGEAAIITSMYTPSREGYDFLGWSDSKTATTAKYGVGAKINSTKDETFYAVWKKSDNSGENPGGTATGEDTKVCKVTFNLNGGTKVDTTIPTEYSNTCGKTITLPTADDVSHPSGYTFKGWGTSASATTSVGTTYTPTTDTTLYIIWDKSGTATITYSVVFYDGTTELTDLKTTAKTGGKITMPNYTKSGYKFNFWTLSGSTPGPISFYAGTSYDVDSLVGFISNQTFKFYANTTKEDGGSTGTKTFTATFYDDYPKSNASKIGTATCTGTSYCKLSSSNVPTATKNGRTFLGWRDDSSSDYHSSNELTLWKEQVNYYAVWDDDGSVTEYTVTYNANGGSVSPTAKVAKSGEKITLPTPARSGYTFNGWYTASSGGSKIGNAGASYTVTKSITLYAHWTANVASGENPPVMETFTATFNGNNGSISGSSNLSCTTDTGSCEISGLPTASRSGYTFKGWGTSQSCTSGSTSTITLSSNKTYYACYVANSNVDDGNNNNDNNNNNNNNNDNSGNVNENPKTGEIAIALTWFIGLIAVGYSFYYFKNVKQN